jgi:hypothetical protein
MLLVEQEEIDLVLAYRGATRPYQATILSAAKRQAAKNKTTAIPLLRLVSSNGAGTISVVSNHILRIS